MEWILWLTAGQNRIINFFSKTSGLLLSGAPHLPSPHSPSSVFFIVPILSSMFDLPAPAMHWIRYQASGTWHPVSCIWPFLSLPISLSPNPQSPYAPYPMRYALCSVSYALWFIFSNSEFHLPVLPITSLFHLLRSHIFFPHSAFPITSPVSHSSITLCPMTYALCFHPDRLILHTMHHARCSPSGA
jgi:hypothetical protein